MDETTRLTETLSPAERRTRLRAYADRMLRLLGASDDPEDGEGKAAGSARYTDVCVYRSGVASPEPIIGR